MTQKLYVLVGVPGSGKSTWIQNQQWTTGIPVVSTDRYVQEYADKQGKTYSEVFEEYMPIAVKLMANQVLICQANKTDIIWDQTSTTIATRARKIRMLPEYYKVAIVFNTPEREELNRRLQSRVGKHIPDHVIDQMIEQWDNPSLDEGFSEIWYAQ